MLEGEPMRIISLLPSITEICFALGLADQVAAVTHECDYPDAARLKPHATRSVLPPEVTDSAGIDQFIAERVAAGLPIYQLDVGLLERVAPDLILIQELCEVCAVSYEDVVAVARQLPKQPQVVSIEPHSVDDVLQSIKTIGGLTGRSVTAEAIVQALQQRINWIGQRLAETSATERRVVCLEWLDPPLAGGHWVPEMVQLAGGRDMLGRMHQDSHRIDWQQVIDAKPEVLVLMPCGYDLPQTVEEAARLRDMPELRAIPAVRHGQVFAVDATGYFSRPGPRLVGGIEILGGILHPEALGGTGPENSAQSVPLDGNGASA